MGLLKVIFSIYQQSLIGQEMECYVQNIEKLSHPNDHTKLGKVYDPLLLESLSGPKIKSGKWTKAICCDLVVNEMKIHIVKIL